jgi:hypothetical protein
VLHGATTTHTKILARRLGPKDRLFQNVDYFGFGEAGFIAGNLVAHYLRWQGTPNEDHFTALAPG